VTPTRLRLFRVLLLALPLAFLWLAIELVLPRVAPAGRVTSHAWGNRPDTRLPGVVHHSVSESFDVSYRANALGFNDEEHARAKPDGTLRVLLLGDSFLEGYTVEPREHLGRVLERLATRDGVRLEAISMGMSGWGQSQQLATYEVVGRGFEPDVVVAFFCTNDLWNNRVQHETPDGPVPLYELGPEGALVFGLAGRPELPPTPEAIRRHERPPLTPGLRALRRLVLGGLRLATLSEEERRGARVAGLYELPDAAGAAAGGGPPGIDPANWLVFEKLAEKLAADVVERDGHVLLNVHVTGNLREKEVPEKWRRVLDAVAQTYARHGVETLNLEVVFRERMRADPRFPTFERDPHWNAVGHEWAAEAIWGWLAPRLAARSTAAARAAR
jgi:lysophospholipase L1-like esterase